MLLFCADPDWFSNASPLGTFVKESENQVKSEKIKNRHIKFQKTIDKYIYKSYNKNNKRKEENNLTDKVKENDS